MKQVYIMRRQDGAMKVGIAQDPEARRPLIQQDVRQPVQLLLRSYPRKDARQVETLSHKILAGKQDYGEWFWVSLDEAKAAVEEAVEICEGRKEDAYSGVIFFPTRKDDTKIHLNLSLDQRTLDAVDNWRRRRFPMPNRSQAIRTMLLENEKLDALEGQRKA